MFLATCVTLEGDEQRRGLASLLYWLMAQNIATQVAGNMLHYAM